MDVYPSRRKIWASILVFAFFLLVSIGAAAAAIAHGPKRSDWFVLVALGLFGWALFSALSELRHPLPLAHFDENGFECALGRVTWANVSAVSVRWHWVWAGRGSHPSRRVFFELRNPAEPPGAEAREYLFRSALGGPVEVDGQIRLPLWDSKERVLADVQRFHAVS